MTKKKRSRRASDSQDTAGGDYTVGYSRPPKEHQFKPGHSGNPKGRPKGAKSEETIFREIMRTKVPMSVRGKTRKVCLLQAVWTRIADDALKGNAKAQALVINRSRSLEMAAPRDSLMREDDEKVLRSYLRQVESEFKTEKEET